MKFGFRTPSLNRRVAARTSVKRAVRQRLGLKAPRGMGWGTNPKRAVYNRIYSRTTFGRGRAGCRGAIGNVFLCALLFVVFVQGPVDKLVSWGIPSSAAWWLVLGGPPLVFLSIASLFLRRAWKRFEAEERAEAVRQEQRRQDLSNRYGIETATRLLNGEIWQGQSGELLREALGDPDATSERVLKTKTKTTHKYFPVGRGHLLHVMLDDDVVVKWLDRRAQASAMLECGSRVNVDG